MADADDEYEDEYEDDEDDDEDEDEDDQYDGDYVSEWEDPLAESHRLINDSVPRFQTNPSGVTVDQRF